MTFTGVVSLASAACAHGPLDTATWRIELFEPYWGPACYRIWRRSWDGRWQPAGEWEWHPSARGGGP
jgi:hypothetical protein